MTNDLGPRGSERTGTVLFIVLDYLTDEGRRGEVKHIYRHDLKSFMWIFAWIFLRSFQEGGPPTSGIAPLRWLDNFGCCEDEEVLFVKFLENFRTLGYRPTHAISLWTILGYLKRMLTLDNIIASNGQRAQEQNNSSTPRNQISMLFYLNLQVPRVVLSSANLRNDHV